MKLDEVELVLAIAPMLWECDPRFELGNLTIEVSHERSWLTTKALCRYRECPQSVILLLALQLNRWGVIHHERMSMT